MKWLFFLLSTGSLAGCYFLVNYATNIGAPLAGKYGIAAVLLSTLIWVFLFLGFNWGGAKKEKAEAEAKVTPRKIRGRRGTG